MARLTDKRRAFIGHYLQCFNATEAARRAEYAHPNKKGPELIHIPVIRDEIEKRMDEIAMQAEEVLARLGAMARGELPTRRVRKPGETEEELHYDSIAALDKIGRHFAMFTDKLKVDWERELLEAGFTPGEEFEKLVQHILAVEANSEEDAGRGLSPAPIRVSPTHAGRDRDPRSSRRREGVSPSRQRIVLEG